ncbi:30S ribosomal protein S11 [Candidatus Uhrbacteria bacterium CG10_big_fil_rev_8_21_14_0_10_48_11]|uniref:Small ribosomal subunit protein uS11 n=1 Tax=Candidatus Uhrbacteria bacterium CG10_big_fil_rev_8_21_14_0_10_48_11 TaxID=1975037 RepID=A0A2M8LED7_9BACT|nr:MAG: 30S ribosomal protein S11 [Candidatus Uhrbacteria bacterium CG10_big_fil_rev_8_21_14_0_10_48_11]
MAEETTTIPFTEANTAETDASKPTKAVRGKRGKKARQVSQGEAHIQATYNNTVVTLTDLNGNVISWSSAGRVGFRGPKKSTPYAAGVIVRDAVERSKAYGLQEVSVYVKGVGSGREAAIRALHANNIAVSTIRDITPIPHNGCRRPRARRV